MNTIKQTFSKKNNAICKTIKIAASWKNNCKETFLKSQRTDEYSLYTWAK